MTQPLKCVGADAYQLQKVTDVSVVSLWRGNQTKSVHKRDVLLIRHKYLYCNINLPVPF